MRRAFDGLGWFVVAVLKGLGRCWEKGGAFGKVLVVMGMSPDVSRPCV